MLQGTVRSRPTKIQCIADTPLLTDGAGRMEALGRLMDVQRQDDGGSWASIATGRLTRLSEDERGRVDIEMQDETSVERRTRIFKTTSSFQLFPPGLNGDEPFMDLEAAGTAQWTVGDVDGQAVFLLPIPDGSKGLRRASRALVEALSGDLIAPEDRDDSATNSDGNFTELRFEYSSTDYKVISFKNDLDSAALFRNTNRSGLLGTLAPNSPEPFLSGVWVYLVGHGVSEGDEITGRLYWPGGIPVNENLPKLVGGADGIHPMTLRRDIMDGTHGGDAEVYDTAAMDDLEDLPFPPVWARITEPPFRGPWLAKNINQPYGVSSLIKKDLSLAPSLALQPQGIDTSSLVTITAADARMPSWDHPSRKAVTVIDFRARQLIPIADNNEKGTEYPVDELRSATVDVRDIEAGTLAALGHKPLVINTELIYGKVGSTGYTEAERTGRLLADAVFNVFQDGPQEGFVEVDDSLGIDAGDLALLDQDTLKGFNPDTDARSGDRLVRILGLRSRKPASSIWHYLDLGPDNAALTAPTVSVAVNGSDADVVDVTISGLAAGTTAVVQAIAADSSPTDYELQRSDVGNATISFRLASSKATAYVRAKAVAPNRIESDWRPTPSHCRATRGSSRSRSSGHRSAKSRSDGITTPAPRTACATTTASTTATRFRAGARTSPTSTSMTAASMSRA